MLLLLGLLITAAAGAWLVWLTLSRPAAAPWPAYGGWALAAMAALELGLALGNPWVSSFFTALIWTAYVVAADAAVFRLRGDSLLHQPRYFAALALLSIPAWLIFEAYNLKLRNWTYVGVPASFWQFTLGAAWAFATILPGIFETADLIHGAGWWRWRRPPADVSSRIEWGLMALGAAMLVLPPLAPPAWAPYCFAPVWGGVVLLLDPWNRRRGRDSLLGDLAAGRWGRACALLAAGGVCGFFWEFWNYWAGAQWRYGFPILHRWRIFAMPVPGFLGFPPFALECFALTVILAAALLPASWQVKIAPAPSARGAGGA